jgi:hypothetical protein
MLARDEIACLVFVFAMAAYMQYTRGHPIFFTDPKKNGADPTMTEQKT